MGSSRAILVAVAYLAILANAAFPVFRFSGPFANYAFFSLAQLLPLLALRSLPPSSGRRRFAAFALGLPVVVLAGLVGLGSFSCAACTLLEGADPSFERLQSVPAAGGALSVYRTNGGAMTSFGIVVRHECTLLPGVLIVRNVASAYPAAEATIELVSPHQANIAFFPKGRAHSVPLVEQHGLARFLCTRGAG